MGFGLSDLKCSVQSSEFRVQGSEFKVQGLGFGVQTEGFGIQCLGFGRMAEVIGFGVYGSRIKVENCWVCIMGADV